MSGPGAAREPGAILGAGLGAAATGAIDAAMTARADSLPGTAAQVGLLLTLEALALGIAAALLVAPLLALLRRAPWGARLGGPALGPLLGVGLTLGLDWTERALRDPPPFTEPTLLQAHPALLALTLLGVLLGVLALARFSRVPRLGRLALPLGLGLAALSLFRPARALPPLGTAAPGAPSLVLITMDTTRDDHVGRANPHSRTPTLDALARDGARFELAISQIPVTGPSHTTMLSGQGPWSHGVLLNGHPIPEDRALITEVLRAQGYRTGAFVSAYVLEGDFGFARGFEAYDDDFGRVQGWAETLPGRLVDALGRHLNPDLVVERSAGQTVDHALGWLRREQAARADAPFFLWVHVFDPHGPYAPPSPWDRAYYTGDPRDPARDTMRGVQGVAPYLLPSLQGITDLDWPLAQYAGEVSYADEQLGRLLGWLDENRPDALVVVAGDHGESLGEHGVWFNHGDDLFEPSTRVPLVLRMKGKIPAGLSLSSPVELTDLGPTALALLGVDAPQGMEGRSLAPWLSATPPEEPPHLFARSFSYDRPANVAARSRGEIERPQYRMVALRTAEGRYLLREAPGEGESWYDLIAAPDESARAPVPEALAGALRASAEALMAGQDRPAADALDAATEERLRALGYVDE